MKNKIWFFISILQFILIFIVFSIYGNTPPSVTETHLKEYINQFNEENNYELDVGYIADSRTAK